MISYCESARIVAPARYHVPSSHYSFVSAVESAGRSWGMEPCRAMKRVTGPAGDQGTAFAPPLPVTGHAYRAASARRPRAAASSTGGCRVDALFGRGPRRNDAPQPPQQSEDRGWFSGWAPRPSGKPDSQDAADELGAADQAAEQGSFDSDNVAEEGDPGRSQADGRDKQNNEARRTGKTDPTARPESPRRFNPLDALFGDNDGKDGTAKQSGAKAGKKRGLFPWDQGPSHAKDQPDTSALRDKSERNERRRADIPVIRVSGSSDDGLPRDGAERGNDIWSRVTDVILPNRKRDEASPGSGGSSTDGKVKPWTRARRSADVGEVDTSFVDGTRDKYGTDYGTGRDSASDDDDESSKGRKVGRNARNQQGKGILDDVLGRLPKFPRKKDSDASNTKSPPQSLGERSGFPKRIGSDSKVQDASVRSKHNADGNRETTARSTRTSSSENSSGNSENNKDEGKPEQGGRLVKSGRSSSKGGKPSGSRTTIPVRIGSPMDISSVPQSDVAAIRNIFGSETFFATETLSPPGGLIFRGNLRGEPEATLAKLEERLYERLGDKYTLCLAEGEEDLRPVVVVVPTARDKRPASPRQRFFSFAIAGLTLSTCYARAVYANWQVREFRTMFGATPDRVIEAAGGGWIGASMTRLLLRFPVASIAIAIAAVVICSQLVQRWMARRHRTRISLPYFIPSYQLGSFGALVQVASPTPSRAALFDIALAGAATLFVVSFALLTIGLRLSGSAGALVMPVPTSMLSGSMMIGWAAKMAASSSPLAVHTGSALVGLHPAAVVGANCLTIAALNLLPLRQLDGGRIVSAIYGRKTGILASRVTIFFLLLASSKSNYLFVFLALILFGPWSVDRPSKNELTEPNNARAVLGYLFHLLMLAVLLPYPGHAPYKL